MKKLKIVVSNKKHQQVGRLARKVIRSGIGLIMILSFLLNRIIFSDSKHVSRHDGVDEEYISNEDEVQRNKELYSLLKKKVPGDSSHDISLNFNSQNLNDQPSKINDYLQDEKVNIYSLNIFLLKKREIISSAKEKEKHWRLLKGIDLYAADFTKALLTDNLTRLVKFTQGFIPERVKTQGFLFYSEVCIKVLIFVLLAKFLQESSPSNEEGPVESLLAFFYNFVYFLPWNTSFISVLPPSNVQQISSFEWRILSICAILVSGLLEEYSRESPTESDKEKSILLRERFWSRIALEITIFILISSYFSGTRGFSERNSSIMRMIGGVLFLANKLISSTVGVVIYWKNKLNRETNEKVF